MKEINYSDIKNNVVKAIYDSCFNLNEYSLNKLREAKDNEDKEMAKTIISQLLENAEIATNDEIPMCQDTGIVTCLVYLGIDVRLNCDLETPINDAVKEAYENYYLRKSVVDPLTRINTKDNTPAIIHTTIVEGDKLTIYVVPKGAGSENMSQIKMLNPTVGENGIVEFVKDVVKQAGGKACPPIYLGIGIGGNFETCAMLAKKALATRVEPKNETISNLKNQILEEVNSLDIGPMGLGGKSTCLDVFIEALPCHIASLPVAVNIQCHANRVEKIEL
ncbi:MAG: fumarate hydratase [Bacilli bacterium]|nr:fumarate hydratase [Bacilli bacterium]